MLALADVVTPNRGELARLAADDSRRSGRPTPGAEDPIRAARTLLETTSEGPGAGKAFLVSLGSSGAILVPHGREADRHQGPEGQGRRRDGCR